MAHIALRAYYKNLESLIEENKIDSALTQCFRLLQKFPKSVRGHQILSKAYLQKQDFFSADKVFNIVLKIIPDDFVSHVGKSMIAENQNSLDDAIEHMKMAFEIQPSNEGLQNELKRLYLSKDGVEPNKIQLSRGALIKMYLKGNLFQQAIDEARIGLSENPQRIDYKISMAEAFYQLNDFIQAIEASIEITGLMPYCWAANEILDKIINKSHSTHNNDLYRNRLIDLDPYYAFMLSSTKSVLDVPDIAVMIEDLDDFENINFDLDKHIIQTWSENNKKENNNSYNDSEFNWESIIAKAVDSPIANIDFKDDTPIYTQDDSENNNFMNYESSRKQIFLDKLRSSKSRLENAEKVQNWYFDEDGEIIQKETDSDENIAQDSVIPEVISKEDHLRINLTSSDEGVLFDTEVQPAISEQDTFEHSNKAWISGEDNSQELLDLNNPHKLDDTQEIIVPTENLTELLETISKALEGGNTKYALSSIKKFLSQQDNISEIENLLNDAIKDHPQQPEFRLLLGELYLLHRENEKALEVFHETQKFFKL